VNPLKDPHWRVGGDPIGRRVFLSFEASGKSVDLSLSIREAERLWQSLEHCALTVLVKATERTALGKLNGERPPGIRGSPARGTEDN